MTAAHNVKTTSKNTTSKTIILSGFGVILLLLICLLLLWLRSMDMSGKRLENIVAEQRKQELVFIMRDSAHKRVLSLFRMASMDDIFERDHEYLKFKRYASEFITARDEYLENHLGNKNEDPGWLETRPLVARSSEAQNKALELILWGDRTGAGYNVLRNEVVPAQELLMEKLADMTERARAAMSDELARSGDDGQTAFLLATSIGSCVLILVIVIAMIVLNRIGHAELMMLEQSARLRTLWETTTLPGMADEQINAILKHGCEFLGAEIAKVCRIDKAAQTNTFLYAYAVPGLSIQPGMVLPLANTFCSIVVDASNPIAISHVANSPYAQHVCYEFSRLESYIAVPLRIKGEVFGTVNFASRTPSTHAFESRDVDLVNLIASWIGATLERLFARQELKVAKEAAESANRAKSNFVANMSHEIRTPLTAIIGYADALSDPHQSAQERQTATSIIARSSRHLANVINDILDLSKIEAGQLQVECLSMSLFEMLAEVESIIGMLARDKGLAFGIHYHYLLPMKIHSDPFRLKQILLNLCGNAVKFTPQGRVDLDIYCEAPTKRLRIVVSDTGVGMDNEEMSRLFQPFSQADVSTTRRFGGTGLGLCISRSLAQKLGGDIAVSSAKGTGSKFEVSLSIGAIEPHWVTQNPLRNTAIEQALQVPNLTGQVLLAEDSAEIQGLISMYVRRTGAGLTIVSNGQEAVEHAMQYEYDLILMDVQMPVLDGLSATRMLRQANYNQPIVSLTANALHDDRERCLAAGANDYIAKPVDLARFYQVLSAFVTPQTELTIVKPTASHDLALDPEFQALVKTFTQGLPTMCAEIERTAAAQNWSALHTVLHKLKGMGGSFGYPALSQASAVVLDGLHAQAYSDIAEQVAVVCRQIQEICADANPLAAVRSATG